MLLARVPTDPEHASAFLADLASKPYPVSLVLPHPLPLEEVLGLDPDRVEWVRTGYSEPWFPLLPESEITRQLEDEASALVDAGVVPGPLWVTGPWATQLPGSFKRAGVEALLIAARSLDVPAPGVVAYLDAVLPIIPVYTNELPDAQASDDEAIAIEVSPDRLDEMAGTIRDRTHCDITTVTTFLAHHRASGRRRPHIDDWEARFGSDADRFILHRKLVRLVTRVPDRLGAAAERAVLEAERADALSGGSLGAAHRAIVEARIAIDSDRRRGDDWWRVSRLDWDADGGEEIHVELPALSMVVAPHRSGAVPTIDSKRPVWPVSAVAGEPGWTLCRFSADLEGLDAEPVELTEVRTTEARGPSVEVELAGEIDHGNVEIDAEVHELTVTLRYRLERLPAGRIGPELKLNLAAGTRLRVDGSEWLDVTEPVAVAGHKLRITDGEHQVVLATLTPCSVFLRPGLDGTGIMLWPHWTTAGTAMHELTIDMTPPTT